MAIQKVYHTLEEANFRVKDIEIDEMVLIEEESAVYKYDGEQFQKIQASEINFAMSLYDINKQVYAQLPKLTKEEIENAKVMINEKFNNTDRKMLLCRELSYYTIFENTCCVKINEFNNLGDAVLTCAVESIGEVLDVTELEGAIEIWLKQPNGEAVASYLFNCEPCFVTYGG